MAVHAVEALGDPTLVARNQSFHRLSPAGVDVLVERDGTKEADHAQLIDFENPANNDFLVVNQFTVTGTKKPRRPDLVVFVNGLPLAVVELKNPADENADVWDAYNQLQTYKDEIADLFVFNEALVVSDGLTARVGSLTADAGAVHAVAHDRQRGRPAALEFELETLVRGFFEPDAVPGLRAALRAVRAGRRRAHQEDRGLPPVPRGARGGAATLIASSGRRGPRGA